MNITILMGSPNRNGSTNMLVREFIRGAEEAGACKKHMSWDVRYSLIASLNSASQKLES